MTKIVFQPPHGSCQAIGAEDSEFPMAAARREDAPNVLADCLGPGARAAQ